MARYPHELDLRKHAKGVKLNFPAASLGPEGGVEICVRIYVGVTTVKIFIQEGFYEVVCFQDF